MEKQDKRTLTTMLSVLVCFLIAICFVYYIPTYRTKISTDEITIAIPIDRSPRLQRFVDIRIRNTFDCEGLSGQQCLEAWLEDYLNNEVKYFERFRYTKNITEE